MNLNGGSEAIEVVHNYALRRAAPSNIRIVKNKFFL